MSGRWTRSVVRMAAVMAVLGASAQAGALGDAKKGKKVFETTCAACHGMSGQGDGPAGGALNPKPRNFTDASVMHKLSDEHLINVITNGGPAVGKSPLMPPWGPSLKPQQIRDVAAYVRAFAPVNPCAG